MLPALDRIKNFDHLELTAKHYLGAQGLLMLMGSKFLIKITRPRNIKMKEQCIVVHLNALQPGHLY